MRIAALSLLAVLTAVCHADTVLTPVSADVELDFPDSSVSYGFSPNQQVYSVTEATGTVSGGNQAGSDPQVSGSLSVSSLPAHISSPVPIDFDSESFLFYEFAVNGPANQTVSINFSSVGTAAVSTLSSGDSLNSTAYLEVTGGNSVLLTDTACAGNPSAVSDPCASTSGPLSNSFNIAQTLTVQTNTAYLVNIYTSDSILAPTGGASGSFTASSSVDPTITLDTSNPAYSLEFSPGLITPSPTPEPTSLMLVATGLAGVATLGRRKLRRA